MAAANENMEAQLSAMQTSALTPSRDYSSLFNFVLAEEQRLAQKLKLKITKINRSDCKAILIKIEPPANFNTLHEEQGYVFVERHLRVDAFYFESSSSSSPRSIRYLTYAHYTETYRHQAGDEIVVHAYFNRLGEFTNNIQVKRSDNALIEADDRYRERLADNFKDAIELLKSLLKFKEEKHAEIVKQANVIEGKLSEYSKQLNIKSVKQQYLKLAPRFLEKIEMMPIYTDQMLDGRAKHIIRMVEIIQKSMIDKSVTVPEKEVEEGTEGKADSHSISEGETSVASASASVLLAQTEPLESRVISEIQQIEQRLKNAFSIEEKDVAVQIEMLNLVQQLKECIVEFMCLERLSKKAARERQDIIAKVDALINQISTFEDCVLQAVYKGDLNAFVLLFEFDRDRATHFKLLGDLIVICMGKTDELSCTRMAICNFLHENSNNYRRFMFFPTGGAVLKPFYSIPGSNVHASLLMTSMLLENVTVFQMLLEHGCDPNEYGLVYQDKAISSLRACIIHDTTNGAVFIGLLIKQGAFLNHLGVTIDMSSISKMKPSDKLQKEILCFAKNNPMFVGNNSAEFYPEYDLAVVEPSCLLFSCKVNSYAVIPTLQRALISKTSLGDLSLAIAYLVDPDNFKMTRGYCTAGFGLGFAQNENEAMSLINRNQENRSNKHIYFVFFPQSPSPQAMVVSQGLYEAFSGEFSNAPPAIIAETIKRGIEKVQKSSNEKNTDIRVYYRATLFLIVQKGQLDKEDIVNIIKLENYMASFYPAKDPRAAMFLGFAQYAVAGSAYRNELEQHVLVKLMKARLATSEATQNGASSSSSAVAASSASSAVLPMLNQFAMMNHGVGASPSVQKAASKGVRKTLC